MDFVSLTILCSILLSGILILMLLILLLDLGLLIIATFIIFGLSCIFYSSCSIIAS